MISNAYTIRAKRETKRHIYSAKRKKRMKKHYSRPKGTLRLFPHPHPGKGITRYPSSRLHSIHLRFTLFTNYPGPGVVSHTVIVEAIAIKVAR